MRRPTPKKHRKILRRPKPPIVLEPGVQVVVTDTFTCRSRVTDTFVVGRGSRVNKLPRSYDEYNPNKVHVARRRKAVKEFNMFPRGWTIEEEVSESYVSQSAVDAIVNGGWLTSTKISNDEWVVSGDLN